MRDEVAKVAGALHARGVGKGDRVLIYMPMIPEGACVRTHVVDSNVSGM